MRSKGGSKSPRVFSPPREHGAYGVWLASVGYGLASLRDPDLPLLVSGLAASLLVLFSLDYVRVTRLSGYSPLVIGMVSLLYLPLVLSRLPVSLPLAAVALALLLMTLSSRVFSNIAGAGLIGASGGFILLSSRVFDPLSLFFPIAYNVLATSQAQMRVTGPRLPSLAGEALGALAVGLFALYFWSSGSGALVPLLLWGDIVTRYLLRLGGVYDRMGLKKYGVVEFIRTVAVQVLVALLLR